MVAEKGNQIKARQPSYKKGKKVLEERKAGHDNKKPKRVDWYGCKSHNQHGPEGGLVKKSCELDNKFMFEDFVEEFLINDVFKTRVVDDFAGQYAGYSNKRDDEGCMEPGKEDDRRIIGNDIDKKIARDGIEEQYPEMAAVLQGLRAEINHKQGRDKYKFADKNACAESW